MREYIEHDSDNRRWLDFEFRPGDIIVDAPSKSGTTWTQLLVALLVFDGPEFPDSLSRLSPWLDHLVTPLDDVTALLATQEHRRFIKSHTPLDGLPMRDEVSYVCVGRDPRDAVVSMMHHGANLDRERYAELLGNDFDPTPRPVETVSERFERWLDDDEFPGWNLRFVAHHYQTFWEHRDRPNVALFHFADYRRDLAGEMSRMAAHLGLTLSDDRAAELAAEAAIERVRDRAADVTPEAHLGLFKENAAFFRSGASGEGAAAIKDEQNARYASMLAELVPQDLAHWIEHGRG